MEFPKIIFRLVALLVFCLLFQVYGYGQAANIRGSTVDAGTVSGGGSASFTNFSATGTTPATSSTTGTVLVGNGTAVTNVGIGGGVGWFGAGAVFGTSPDALHGFVTLSAAGSSDQLTGYSASTFIYGLGRDTNGILVDSLDTIALMTGSASGPRTGVRAMSFSTVGNATLLTKFVSYNGVAAVGSGVPAIYGAGRVTAQAAANASISTYTGGAADGSFEVSANMNVTVATVLSTTLTCSYTDESNTARVMILPVQQLTGSFIAGGAITGTGAWESAVMHIRCKASTSITIGTTAGTFTGVTYTAEGIIKQTN